MSLRGRLWLIIVIAGATLAIAVLSVLHALRSTDAARLESAEAGMAATVSALAKGFSSLGSDSLPTAAAEGLIRPSLAVIATAVPETQVGYCTRTGELFATAARGKKGDLQVSPKPLPPDQREAVASACRNGDAHRLIKHPSDTVLISTLPVAPDGAAWALRRIESRDDDDPWTVYVALLSAATAILVGATVTTMIALNRGVKRVRSAVLELREDLELRLWLRRRPSSRV